MNDRKRSGRIVLFAAMSFGLVNFSSLAIAAPFFLKAKDAATVTLTPETASPQPVATPIYFDALATGFSGEVDYRFSVTFPNGVTQIIRDYHPYPKWKWTATTSEGQYVIKVDAKEMTTGQIVSTTLTYVFTTRAGAGFPVISSLENPLMALYSAPPCPLGSSMEVKFWLTGTDPGTATTTLAQACRAGVSSNFFLAGMRPSSTYQVQQCLITNGLSSPGTIMSYTTGAIPASVSLPEVSISSPVTPATDSVESILLHSFILTPGGKGAIPAATDLTGQYIWYYTPADETGYLPTQLMRANVKGKFLLTARDGHPANPAFDQGALIQITDLAGNIERETNIEAVANELFALGAPDRVTEFNHDVIQLPNGHLLTLAYTDRLYPAGTQGSPVPVDIIGDYIVDLDTNLQVSWYWNSFDHLDINRAAVLGETCHAGATFCPPLQFLPVANDWLHGNSLNYIPSDGNILLSMRNQDWVIKIDYENGAGTGNVIWHLGNQGDFTMISNDPWPWFSHQHDVAYENGGTTTLSLFDNGNTRIAQNPTENSRGQVYSIDEANFTVTPVINADLGIYAQAFGSAQALTNGNYHFMAGIAVLAPNTPYASRSIEVLPDGTLNYSQDAQTETYRTFRLHDLYNATVVVPPAQK